jgi:hypothetical protein
MLIFIVSVAFASQFQACKTAEGCALEEKYQVKTDKDGNLSSKRGKSGLFSKKTRKKMEKK